MGTSSAVGLQAGAQKYIAHPASTTNMIYQTTAGSTNRAYSGNANYALKISPTGGVSIQHTAALSAPLRPAGTGGSLGASSDDLDNFFKNVVHGADNIASMTWNAVENGAEVVINGIKSAYHISVSAVEHALVVVAGILKSVLKDILKAVEWLSYLFDWNAVLNTKKMIEDPIIAAGKTLATFQFDPNSIAKLQTALTNMANEITTSLGNVKNKLGGNTAGSQQQQNNNPQVIYGPKGAKSYSPTRWTTSKVKNNAAQGQIVSTAGLTGSDDPAVAALENILKAVTTALGKFKNLPGELLGVVKSFSTLISDPDQFVASTLTSIITLVESIAVDMVNFLNEIVVVLFQELPALLSAAINMVQQQIKIPVVDDLSQAISGDPLTLLDLFALIIAIPTHIVSAIIPPRNNTMASGLLGTAGNTIQGYSIIFAGAIYAIFDASSDLLGDENLGFEAYLTLALSLFLLIPNFPFDISSDTSVTWWLYALSMTPLVISVAGILADKYKGSPFAETWSEGSQFVNPAYGIIFLTSACYAADKDSEAFGGETLAENIILNFPYIAKFFADGPPTCPSRIGVSVIDGLCDLTGAGLGAAIAWGS